MRLGRGHLRGCFGYLRAPHPQVFHGRLGASLGEGTQDIQKLIIFGEVMKRYEQNPSISDSGPSPSQMQSKHPHATMRVRP
jgi:hypothetical protein